MKIIILVNLFLNIIKSNTSILLRDLNDINLENYFLKKDEDKTNINEVLKNNLKRIIKNNNKIKKLNNKSMVFFLRHGHRISYKNIKKEYPFFNNKYKQIGTKNLTQEGKIELEKIGNKIYNKYKIFFEKIKEINIFYNLSRTRNLESVKEFMKIFLKKR